ncbi:MAG: iron-containing alcohol dehydrogenase [Candidatus Helarchaeota archaeon]
MEVLKIPRLVIGKGTTKILKNLKGESILIVTDKIIRELAVFSKILKYLKKTGMKIEIFDEVEPDPRDVTIEKGLKMAKAIEPTWFIAIGGGSSMDAAKAIQFSFEIGTSIKEIDALKAYNFKSKLIAIPTTSGTGSEASYACVITDTSNENKKMACVNPVLTPYMAILDPKIPSKMPKSLTISTAIDALVHSIESLISNLRNEFTKGMSLHAIELIFTYLPQVLGDLDNVQLREKLHVAAFMAGIAMSGAGLGLCHGIGHSLGTIFHIPHGNAVGCSLIPVLEFSRLKIQDQLKNVYLILDLKPDQRNFDSFIEFLKDFFKKINFPTNLKELEISKEELDKNIEKLISFTLTDSMTGLNPRQVTKEELEMIYNYMIDGKKIDF